MRSIWHNFRLLADRLRTSLARRNQSEGHLQPRPIPVVLRARNGHFTPLRRPPG
jgi:hypothetical protein